MNRAEFENLISAIKTFVGVLLILLFAVAVTSGDAFKGPDAFTLRWTVISLAVAFSAVVAWFRWTSLRRRVMSSGPPHASAVKSAPDVSLVTARQAIVFRQHFPPQHTGSALSFFGGVPVAPRGFRWPRPSSAGSKPFDFLMQIDCAAVPAAARLGMLPDRGVLYFFHDLTWGQPDSFRVLYEEGGNRDWAPVRPPDDLDVAYGKHASFQWKWPQSAEDCPKLLPRWTFDPVAIEIPSAVRDPEEEDSPVWWPGEKVTAEALRAAQGEEVLVGGFPINELVTADGGMVRPFENYPHDWRAIQICSGLVLERVGKPHRLPSTHALRHLSETDRDALVTRIKDEASRWYSHAASQIPFAAVPRKESDQFWAWLSDKTWLVRFVISDALTMSIEASLSESAEAGARIPADIARRVRAGHALAVRTELRLYASEPDRMLAPPVDVQGHQWDRAKTHLLLLELKSNEGLGHHFGEGVYQFWLTPADLKARRFDKVELTADAY